MSDKLKTINGNYTTTLTEKYKNRTPWTKPDPRLVMSYIPGTITDVFVTKGQLVKIGEPLLAFNAMKMANTYASPRDGKISKINATKGLAVPKGAVLIEFE